ncbi:MAG: hypothetical protein CL804_03500 [Citromicrobium sp.]|mgnify:CR=1 FL=1|nr:hypothetical protein [Citromicrobium sp.]|tara:strand:- start:7482 stop:7709 length:228 start_codon:yes stop_codon:yes gene_type:complete
MAAPNPIPRIKFWHSALATFLLTQILYGVEGWLLWAVAMVAGWLFTMKQPHGEKSGWVPLGIWSSIMAISIAFGF